VIDYELAAGRRRRDSGPEAVADAAAAGLLRPAPVPAKCLRKGVAARLAQSIQAKGHFAS